MAKKRTTEGSMALQEIRFRLKNGLELTETIERTMR